MAIKCTPKINNCQNFAQPESYEFCNIKSPSEYAQVAKRIEPMGVFWDCLSPLKMALHKAFGSLLSDFERAMCKLQKESLACGSTELINEFEADYGLPSGCSKSYPTDLAGRQDMVCAAKKSIGISTIDQIQDLLQTATNCPNLKITDSTIHSTYGGWTGGYGQPLQVSGGVCITGIIEPLIPTSIPYCPIIYHSTYGGHTGGYGQPLTTQDDTKFNAIKCLTDKHIPASINWEFCGDYNLPPQPAPVVHQPVFYSTGSAIDINYNHVFTKVLPINILPAGFDYLTDLNGNIISVYKILQSLDFTYYPNNFNIPLEVNNQIIGYLQE